MPPFEEGEGTLGSLIGEVMENMTSTIDQSSITHRLIDCGLEIREAEMITHLQGKKPLKASEIAMQLDTSRMDVYSSLRRLQARGIARATVERPMRFQIHDPEKVLQILKGQIFDAFYAKHVLLLEWLQNADLC